MNFYVVTTTGHGLFGARYYAFGLMDAFLALGGIVVITAGCTLYLSTLLRRSL